MVSTMTWPSSLWKNQFSSHSEFFSSIQILSLLGDKYAFHLTKWWWWIVFATIKGLLYFWNYFYGEYFQSRLLQKFRLFGCSQKEQLELKFKNDLQLGFVQIHPAHLPPDRPLLKGRFHTHSAPCPWVGDHLLWWRGGRRPLSKLPTYFPIFFRVSTWTKDANLLGWHGIYFRGAYLETP